MASKPGLTGAVLSGMVSGGRGKVRARSLAPTALFAMAAAFGIGAEAVRVGGELSLLVEDHFAVGRHYAYGTMVVQSSDSPALMGRRIYLAIPPASTTLHTHDNVVLDVAVVMRLPAVGAEMYEEEGPLGGLYSIPGPAPQRQARLPFLPALPPVPLWDTPRVRTTGATVYRVQSVVSAPTAPPTAAPGQRDRRSITSGERTVVLVRVQYEDYGPAHCDEACFHALMFNGTYSVNGIYNDASTGRLEFVEPPQVYTVHMPGLATRQNCAVEDLADGYDTQLLLQHNVSTSDYMHRSYYIPEELPGCYWAGIAHVGCSGTYCRSWIRLPPSRGSGPTLAHELGHNLGLWHAATDPEDDGTEQLAYGDKSCFMGSDQAWRSLNAPHRMDLGWIPTDSVEHLDRVCGAEPIRRTLTSLSTVGSPEFAINTVSALGQRTFVLRLTREQPGGGFYYISLRTSFGPDAMMPTMFVDSVALHYTSPSLANSQLVGLLPANSSAGFATAGFHLSVGSVSWNATEVTLSFCEFAQSTTTTATMITPPPPCAGHVEITGRVLAYNSDMNGVYERQTDMWDGKASYAHSRNGLVLYHIAQYDVWAIGTVLGSASVHAYVTANGADTPAALASTFMVYNGENAGGFQPDAGVQVSCVVPRTTISTTTTTSTSSLVSTISREAGLDTGTSSSGSSSGAISSAGAQFGIAVFVTLVTLSLVLAVYVSRQKPRSSVSDSEAGKASDETDARNSAHLSHDNFHSVQIDGASKHDVFSGNNPLYGAASTLQGSIMDRTMSYSDALSNTSSQRASFNELDGLISKNPVSARDSLVAAALSLEEYMATEGIENCEYAAVNPSAVSHFATVGRNMIDQEESSRSAVFQKLSTEASSLEQARTLASELEGALKPPSPKMESRLNLARSIRGVLDASTDGGSTMKSMRSSVDGNSNGSQPSDRAMDLKLALANEALRATSTGPKPQQPKRSGASFATGDAEADGVQFAEVNAMPKATGGPNRHRGQGKSRKERGLPPPSFERPPSFEGSSPPSFEDALVPPPKSSGPNRHRGQGKSRKERGLPPPVFERPPEF